MRQSFCYTINQYILFYKSHINHIYVHSFSFSFLHFDLKAVFDLKLLPHKYISIKCKKKKITEFQACAFHLKQKEFKKKKSNIHLPAVNQYYNDCLCSLNASQENVRATSVSFLCTQGVVNHCVGGCQMPQLWTPPTTSHARLL